jgi:16S rRNA G966 N2-methylase RsmD
MIEKLNSLKRKESIRKRLEIIETQNAVIENQLKELNWANIFNSATVGSIWLKDVSLNVGRWAANYSFLYILFRILNEIKPENILELGLGETTKMIQAYKQHYNQNAFCTTIEQDDEWIEMRLNSGISKEYINIIKADVERIKTKDCETLVYKDLGIRLETLAKKFNLILIDGPWGSPNYSRYNVINLLERGLIAEDFIIIMDDYNRKGEQETINDLMENLKTNNYIFFTGKYEGNKGQIILASSKYKYLESL